MPNFQAKTKEELYQPEQPKQLESGKSVPSADFESLRELGATEFYPRVEEIKALLPMIDSLKEMPNG